MMPHLWCEFLLLTGVLADYLVAPRVVNSVNYDDFSLLCADGIPLLMEDHRPQPCHPRPWLRKQKCPSGFWCHEGDDESSHYCCPRNRKVANRCHLSPAIGHGKKALRRFYYDWASDGCHELTYTGLGGNENSFITYEQCENACRGVGEPAVEVPENAKLSKNKKVTKLPSSTVPSTATSNTSPATTTVVSTSRNEDMTTTAGLISTDRPSVDVTVRNASTTAGIQDDDRLRYTRPYPMNIYVIVDITGLRTTTRTTTIHAITMKSLEVTTPEVTTAEHGNHLPSTRWMGTNPCEQDADEGHPGDIARKMWYFDKSALSCRPFTYLGSDGNANRFVDQNQCLRVCGSGFSGKPSLSACDLQPQFGNGTYKIPRYYFDKMTKQCELFFYSGEGGNENRFLRKQKCERLCLGRSHATVAPAPMPTSEKPNVTVIESSSQLVSTSSAKTTTAESFPTLVNVPKEFVPPFPQFTLLPHDNAPTTTDAENLPFKTTTRPPTTVSESLDSIFEKLMASSPAPPATARTLSTLSSFEEVSEPRTSVALPGNLKSMGNSESGSDKFPGFHSATILPHASEQWRIRLPANELRKPVLPVVAVTEAPRPNLPPSPYAHIKETEKVQPIIPAPVNENHEQIPHVVYISHPNGDPTATQVNLYPTEHRPGMYTSANHNVLALQEFEPYAKLRKANVSQNSVWLAHGMRAFQQVMQQQRTSTITPFEPYFVASIPSSISTTGSPSEERVAVLTQEAQKPDILSVAVFPENDVLLTAQPTSTNQEKMQAQVNSSNVSPCHIPIYDDVVIMCALANVTCPFSSKIANSAEAACHQPVRPGIGPSSLLRWYFDPAVKQCLPFSFHGFQGNQNNFESVALCESACIFPQFCDEGSPVPSTNVNESRTTVFSAAHLLYHSLARKDISVNRMKTTESPPVAQSQHIFSRRFHLIQKDLQRVASWNKIRDTDWKAAIAGHSMRVHPAVSPSYTTDTVAIRTTFCHAAIANPHVKPCGLVKNQ
ncbi:Kunitz/Bovine pancreatic trypsin inhibitor domain protein [Necator americanus]|uniref:Kunitz/Bovine pancreatic trypsin inhibitor domain protein n=1 Tax=Necator americanus TaxID=51031 RepID=W2TI78_NECAM|nr:Kunitz/Bovine pancreatic trypsin inhibitor domain protein [Necator americanus]ETN80871.1 Kunitz/Bovine pancreatic trypsin inhibitor domain protein [Necator americanus]